MSKNEFKRDTAGKKTADVEVIQETEIKKEELTMKPITKSNPTTVKTGNPFYYGYYSVDHPSKKGQLMDILKEKGETRKCPCLSIAVSLDDVEAMVALGYKFKNKDADIFSETITKYNIRKYITKIKNLIDNGFLKEQ